MRSASGSLISLLNSQREVLVADLLTIAQVSGAITRLTSADFDVTAVSKYDNASHAFSSKGPPFTRGKTKLTIGVEVDTMDLTIYPRNGIDLLGGVPWPAAAIAGALDEARVMIERVYTASWADMTAGTLIVFTGRVGEIDPKRNEIKITVRSDLELLQQLMPRNVYQPGCVHTLYDAGCTLLASTFAVSGTVASGSTTQLVNTTSLAQATGYFDLGKIKFTSGALNGLTFTVKTYVHGSPSTVAPIAPFPAAPVAGDTFTIYPGCDKTESTCSSKFANLAHFKAFPFIPAPEAAR